MANVIDNQPTKYLNFDKLNTGFTVTPTVGGTLVTGLSLTSANDAPERDPSRRPVPVEHLDQQEARSPDRRERDELRAPSAGYVHRRMNARPRRFVRSVS